MKDEGTREQAIKAMKEEGMTEREEQRNEGTKVKRREEIMEQMKGTNRKEGRKRRKGK